MYSYREQVEALAPIRLSEGQGRRIDCPFCGGRSTMYISNRDGKRLWHCFRASCGTSGSKKVGRSLEGLQKAVAGVAGSVEKKGAPLPAHTSRPEHHEAVMEYLSTNGSLEAYQSGLVKIRYAPAEQRVLFYMQTGKGAVGRSLIGERPKWKAYGDTTGMLRVGKGKIAVVVEDAASAASIARLPKCSGCALLGTHLTSYHKSELREYARIVVALDEDASRKAIKIKGRLEGIRPTSVLYLSRDLKYLTRKQLEELGI